MSGKLVIQRRAGQGWRKLHREQVGAGRVFTARLSFRGKAELRAKVGGQTSLTWPQGEETDKVIEVGQSKGARQAHGPIELRESVSGAP